MKNIKAKRLTTNKIRLKLTNDKGEMFVCTLSIKEAFKLRLMLGNELTNNL